MLFKQFLYASTFSLYAFFSCLAPVLAVEEGSNIQVKDSYEALHAAAMRRAEALTLEHLRDIEIPLHQIKLQAINIFMEVTRTPVHKHESGSLVFPNSIAMSKAIADTKYLPARPEWILFYVANTEPIIHLFKEDIKDVQSGTTNILISAKAKKPLRDLWRQWAAQINDLNGILNQIYNSIDVDTPNNVAIAKEAVEMFKAAHRLEQTRQKAFKIVQSFPSQGDLVKIKAD